MIRMVLPLKNSSLAGSATTPKPKSNATTTPSPEPLRATRMVISLKDNVRDTGADPLVTLVDHGVHPGQHGGRRCDAEGTRRLAVEHELELPGLLDRQVGRSGSLDDAIDVVGGATEHRQQVRTIGDESAGVDELTMLVDGGQSILGREVDDPRASGIEPAGREDDQRVGTPSGHGGKGVLDVLAGAGSENVEPYAGGRGRRLRRA